jgi:hypothetical protein
MSVMIGDLMAVAEERDRSGGERDKSKKKGRRYKAASGSVGANECIGPSARKERGPEDDKSIDDEFSSEDPPRTASLGTCGKLPPKLMGGVVGAGFFAEGDGDGDDCVEAVGRQLSVRLCVRREWEVVEGAGEVDGSPVWARGYAVHASVYVGRKIVGLTDKDIDVLIGYIASRDIWYVVPVRAFMPRKNLWFYPDGSKKGAMFEKYRGAWGIMTGR